MLNPSRTRGISPGFTVVEVLIVIVVIAILAAISIVTYQGITDRARDADRRTRANQLAKTINVFMLKNQVQHLGGNGSAQTLGSNGLCRDETSHHGGWVYSPTTYQCDMGKMLLNQGLVSEELFTAAQENDEKLSLDPGNVAAFMFLGAAVNQIASSCIII